jgi:long-subunit acyl-CoA synthetase (AMP-forming)
VVPRPGHTTDTEAITARLASANATFSRDEQIKDVVIARERFSVANGMLTTQFKPRRQRILQTYWTSGNAVQRKDRDAG